MIDFICKTHSNKGIQCKDWGHFRTYTYGCSYCSGRGKTNEDIAPLIKNPDVILISEYKGNEKPILCKCRKCGNEWETMPKVLITNRSGCPLCGRKKRADSRRKTAKQFATDLAKVNKNIRVIGKYINTHSTVKCQCLIDGTIWDAYPSNLLNSSAGCPTCHLSKGESRLLSILSYYKINYIPQYSIPDCKNKKVLRFDAFDIEHNIAFEYNGEQHYRPVSFGNTDENYVKAEFKLNKKRDKIKREYCIKHNIPLIIIPYWEKENMEEIIVEKIITNIRKGKDSLING